MLTHLLKSKIHRAQVTAANLEYEGSMTIDRDLMDKVGLLPYERILCGNMANGERFETYAIPAEAGSGQIILNGATARLGKVGPPHHHELRRRRGRGGQIPEAKSHRPGREQRRRPLSTCRRP